MSGGSSAARRPAGLRPPVRPPGPLLGGRSPEGRSSLTRRVRRAIMGAMTTTDPGWHPDPTERHEHRYWDGAEWTEHVADAGEASTDPIVAGPGVEALAEDDAPGETEPESAAGAWDPTAGGSAPFALPFTAKGLGGQLILDENFVTIARKGALAAMGGGMARGEKRIPIGSITAVQFKKPGGRNGYIQFTIPGGNEVKKRGVAAAAKDENTVVFTTFHAAEFEAVRDYVERRIVERHAPQTVQAAPTKDLPTQLRELAALRDEGLLSDAEFEAEKAKLLSRTD